jgi:2-(1,2-epoxy-1,2-dihydrophenyl)acetyl-CoA isomerase
MQTVLLERDGSVATVILNRPERRNALDRITKAGLVDALANVAGDPDVRAVVLTGAGGSFCVGQDLAEHAEALQADPATAFDTVAVHYTPIVTAIATMPKPVVAAVNGACVGAGLALALACDLRVLSAQATLATAFSGIGLTCDSGLSGLLARSVGEPRARELVLLGEPFGAAELVTWGVAGTVVDPDEVRDTAHGLASRLASGATLAFAESKRLLADALDRPLGETLAAETAAQARAGMTQDHRNAVDAFLAKRRPHFDGR